MLELTYRTIGHGPPLIMLHGLCGAGHNWLSLARQLASHYQVFLPDLRNHGRSPWHENGSYDAMSADILTFVNSHRLLNPIVVGHSLGGMVAMWYATRYYPPKLSHLLVVDMGPQGYPLNGAKRCFSALMDVKLDTLATRDEADHLLSLHIPQKPLRQFLLSNLIRSDKGSWEWRLNLPVLYQHLDHYGTPLPDNLSMEERPVLFIRGEHSDHLPPEIEPVLQQYFPQSKCVNIPAGHWIHIEHPQLLLQHIQDFLGPSG